jgi:hypothetical protein
VAPAAHADLVGSWWAPACMNRSLARRSVPFMTRTDTTPAVLVEVRVEDQGLQRRVGSPTGRRDALDDGVEQLGDALAGLGADAQDLLGGMPSTFSISRRSGRGRRPAGRSC